MHMCPNFRISYHRLVGSRFVSSDLIHKDSYLSIFFNMFHITPVSVFVNNRCSSPAQFIHQLLCIVAVAILLMVFNTFPEQMASSTILSCFTTFATFVRSWIGCGYDVKKSHPDPVHPLSFCWTMHHFWRLIQLKKSPFWGAIYINPFLLLVYAFLLNLR